MLKIIFIISAFIAATSIILGKLFVFGQKKPVIVSNYAASVGALLGIYSILAIAMITQGGYIDKFVMFLFAISPYLIGRITTFRSVNFFTMVQILTLILSALYAMYCID